ncbi:MAG: metal-dependent transcriptional regulator [Proteobacteria bacterium]|nr:metal-dependent transcriptional regulator [Pseudomonadota bacterium]
MIKERKSVVVEEYLQVIYSLLADQKPVKAVTLTKWLKSSPSTVHATLSRLQRDKLVKVNKKKEINLTAKGLEKAETLTRRHRLVEAFLCDKLGISWHEVHKHAHVLEHGLTPLVEEKLAEFLDFPQSCPHGTPLPGVTDFLPKNTVALDECEPGDEIEIVNIGEALEESLDLMKFLQDKSIKPGKRHSVKEKTDITKTIVLEYQDDTATLTYDIAQKIGAVKC